MYVALWGNGDVSSVLKCYETGAVLSAVDSVRAGSLVRIIPHCCISPRPIFATVAKGS